MVRDPRCNLIVGRTGGDERPKVVIVNLRKLQPALIERAVRVVVPFPANEHCATFVHSPRREHITSQCLTRTAWKLFPLAQVARQQFYFFVILVHTIFFSLILMFGKMAVDIRVTVTTPTSSIKIAITVKPYGRLSAKRTIHILFTNSNAPEHAASTLQPVRCARLGSDGFANRARSVWRIRGYDSWAALDWSLPVFASSLSRALSQWENFSFCNAPFSTSRLKLCRYSSTLSDRPGGSKIERIFSVTSVSPCERGSKDTTPDMKPLDIVRHAMRRPGICSTMWKTPFWSSPFGCHV